MRCERCRFFKAMHEYLDGRGGTNPYAKVCRECRSKHAPTTHRVSRAKMTARSDH